MVGYAGVEKSSATAPSSFRAFIVLDWREPHEFAELLWSMIEADLVDLRADQVWMREYAGDRPMAAFISEHGLAPEAPVPTDPLEHLLFSRSGLAVTPA